MLNLTYRILFMNFQYRSFYHYLCLMQDDYVEYSRHDIVVKDQGKAKTKSKYIENVYHQAHCE